jgi:D-arabinose 1-dehydrogenase-like Zn-dependent alcohol dehydrogenase
MNQQIPDKSEAIQLIGPDEFTLNTEKPVPPVGPYQILGRIEATGLCFSDLKLLKQFEKHARKSDIISGVDRSILDEIPSYVPDNQPTVPGHESVVRICAVGEKVEGVTVGARYLVQTDYRWLPTENANASFGYNFEGGLQEYVLLDQRIIVSPAGDLFLLPASEDLSASAVALVEPWACVEDAYSDIQRKEIKAGGKMLVVAESPIDEKSFTAFLNRFGSPEQITWVSDSSPAIELGVETIIEQSLEKIEDLQFDDVIYFGANRQTCEKLFSNVGPQGLFNIVQCGDKFGGDVTTQIGRTHYGGIRIVGTRGPDPAESMERIPDTGEIRPGDKINVIGAGGPMGVMHVIRNICEGIKDVQVFAGDMDSERLGILERIAAPIAEDNSVTLKTYDPVASPPAVKFDYVALMAPIPKLVADSVKTVADGCIINIFAGIPANVTGEIDLDAYIEKKLYFIGTSGSVIADMKKVLAQTEAGSLETNISVAAVCGLVGAIEGIRAVENRLIPGKIVVYPSCKGMPLTTLEELGEKYPDVAEKFSNGLWNKEAEDALLKHFSS